MAPALVALFAAVSSATAQDSSAQVLQPAPSPAPRLLGDTIPHPAPGVLELRASLSEKTLYVMRGDTLLAQYPIAIGTDEHPTPKGDFRIRTIVWNPRWVPPAVGWARGKTPKEPGSPANPMQTVKIFFQEPDYYIHGTPSVESLGTAASHGCLRMDPNQAAEVARLIMEHGGEPREENWFWRVLHFRSETKTVSLENPIRMVVD